MIDFLMIVGAAIIGAIITQILFNKFKSNKKCSLSEVSKTTNKTSQYKGVYFDRTKNRWKSGITINKVRYNAGSFKTEEEAYYALEQLKGELNYEG